MKKPESIEKGTIGWKNRRLEILILEVFDRAAVPHTKHRMWQKLQRKVSTCYDSIYKAMMRLVESGYLSHVGHDEDYESLFTARKSPHE